MCASDTKVVQGKTALNGLDYSSSVKSISMRETYWNGTQTSLEQVTGPEIYRQNSQDWRNFHLLYLCLPVFFVYKQN